MRKNADREAGSSRADRAGAICSGACAVHCASLSLFPSAATSFGLGVLAGSTVEWGLTILAVACAGIAFATGWRKHRTAAVAIAFALGLAGLSASRVLEELDAEGVGTAIGIGGAVALVVAHALNYHKSRRLGWSRA